MTNKVQIIKDDATGKPAFAVLAWADYERLTTVTTGGAPSAEALFDAAMAAGQGLDPLPDEFAGRIFDGENPVKVLREWRGLKQGELADKVNISRNYLSEIEGGKPARMEVMARIARALGVLLDNLIPAAA